MRISTYIAYLFLALKLVIAGTGVMAAIQVALTREDAFDVADRKPKWIWFAFVAISALVIALPFSLSFLPLIGMVMLGVYWFDVRPQIKDILEGSNDPW